MSGLVFGIMSAIHRPDTVAQLCRALAPHHVVIHHDFGQQADFRIDLPHVEFVPVPRPTGWESFAFTEGIMCLLDYCLRDPSLRYFQLLSPTCLPIRPVETFAAHVFANPDRQADAADIDGIDILGDHEVLMNFGYRIFAPADSWRLRALFKASTWYFGKNPAEKIQAGLSVRIRDARARFPAATLAEWSMKAAQSGLLGRHPFGPDYRPYMGSAWFGAGRNAVRYLLDHLEDEREMACFRRLAFPDEVVLSTVLHNSDMVVGEANHLLKAFDGSRPVTLGLADVDNLQPGSKYFARKFVDDPDDPARRKLLQSIMED